MHDFILQYFIYGLVLVMWGLSFNLGIIKIMRYRPDVKLHSSTKYMFLDCEYECKCLSEELSFFKGSCNSFIKNSSFWIVSRSAQ